MLQGKFLVCPAICKKFDTRRGFPLIVWTSPVSIKPWLTAFAIWSPILVVRTINKLTCLSARGSITSSDISLFTVRILQKLVSNARLPWSVVPEWLVHVTSGKHSFTDLCCMTSFMSESEKSLSFHFFFVGNFWWVDRELHFLND